MREALEGLEGRQIAMNGEEEEQQWHHGGMALGLELESRTTVVPWAKRLAKCGRRSTERRQEEQTDLSPALRPSPGTQMEMTQL